MRSMWTRSRSYFLFLRECRTIKCLACHLHMRNRIVKTHP